MRDLNFKTIGLKVKERRISCRLTQEYVAEKLDVNPSHISNIEGGRANPSLTALVNIANTLECSVDYFINDEYIFHTPAGEELSMDEQIIEKCKNQNTAFKAKLLKIIDILKESE